MQKPPVPTRVVPANALFHFALPQREYSAVLAAVQYFATKLQNPRERDLAASALQWLQNINGMSLPSEAGGTGAEEPKADEEAPTSTAPVKGLEGLKGRKE
jgi:hypothetical protein